MKPRRTENTDRVLRMPGGNEDNDLWYYLMGDGDGTVVICSVWQPTDEERAAIARGENVRLVVWGTKHPPVTIDTTDEKLGRKEGP